MKKSKKQIIFEKRLQFLIIVQIVVFTILVLRLWFLQVIEFDYYRVQAEENRLREESIKPLRGDILDRNGQVLATNRFSYAIFIEKESVGDLKLYKKLENILGEGAQSLRKRAIKSRYIKENKVLLIKDLTFEQISLIQEEKEKFPGITVSYLPIRSYPRKELASHVIGYVSEISQKELEEQRFPGAERGDEVGKTGVEKAYDIYLRGSKGRSILEVDALGNIKHVVRKEEPIPGKNVVLTIDANIQSVTEKALLDAIALANSQKFTKAKAGAAIVLNVKNGEIVALASYPTYDPNVFVTGIDQELWNQLSSSNNNFPLLNRVTNAAYPPGSTFKPLTLISAIDNRLTYLGEGFT